VAAEANVLLISQVYYPDQVAVANLFTSLCSVVAESGVKIEVWCAQPSYTNLERQPVNRTHNGVLIKYLPSTNYPKDKLLGRVLNVLSFSFSSSIKLLFSSYKSYVLSHTTPPFLAIVISFICRIKKLRNIYVIMDVFPDGLIRLKKVSSTNILIRYWRKIHFVAIKKCYKIVVVGRDMKKWLISNCPDVIDKTIYIPLWQDDELIKPFGFDDNPFTLLHKLQTYFVVQYSGNMGLWNDMKTFGEAVNRKPANVFFIFIGGGMRIRELLESFDNPEPANSRIIPFLPNTEYAYSVSACHAALVSLQDGLEGMAVPSKIIGIMAAGVPVIALVPEESEIAYIIKEEKCGIVVKPGDIDGLVTAIELLRDNISLRNSMGARGRLAFERKYTTRIIGERYKLLIQE
jgi:glycosyltransferase involved in cell wall biosynthesis